MELALSPKYTQVVLRKQSSLWVSYKRFYSSAFLSYSKGLRMGSQAFGSLHECCTPVLINNS